MAIEKLNTNYKAKKIKPGTIHKLRTSKTAINSDLPHDTKIQNACILNS
jgi:hypothetical protein